MMRGLRERLYNEILHGRLAFDRGRLSVEDE
jgi:hypothetical protein